jgi:hypothetical protein
LLDFLPRSSFAVARIGVIRSPSDAAEAAAKIARSIVNGAVDADTGNNAIAALQSAASMLTMSAQLEALWSKVAELESRGGEPPRPGDDPDDGAPWRKHVGNGNPP